jgi:DNA-binding MarR family transcriptional regulator
VTRLVAAGLLEVLEDPLDSRSGLVSLTGPGLAEVLAVRERRLAPLRGVIEPWPAEDRDRFAALLLRFNADIDAGA